MSILPIEGILLKIPPLVAAAYAGQTTLTPPNGTPQDGEQQKYGSRRDTVTSMIWILPAVKASLWLATACEVITLLARCFPDSILSDVSPRLCLSEAGGDRLGLSNTFVAGWLLIMSGSALRDWCFRELGRHFTFHLAVRNSHKLVTSGPYAIVRHPAYLGFLVYGAGSVMCLFGSGSWTRECGILGTVGGQLFAVVWTGLVVAISLLFFGRAALEDETLRKEFEGQWAEYARRTRYRIIPYIY